MITRQVWQRNPEHSDVDTVFSHLSSRCDVREGTIGRAMGLCIGDAKVRSL